MSTISRRNYLTLAELAQFADVTITDNDEALDNISQAEELLDAYIGPQDKAIPFEIFGKASGGSSNTLILDPLYRNNYPYIDYFAGCIVEIIGGASIGDRKVITTSAIDGTMTCETFTTAIDSTSAYKIYQLGKFPRAKDTFFNSYETPNRYYKPIIEAIKRAVAAQVQFIIEMGPKYFSTDASEKMMEKIDDYEYQKGKIKVISPLIAPKAQVLLRGYVNRTGEIIA